MKKNLILISLLFISLSGCSFSNIFNTHSSEVSSSISFSSAIESSNYENSFSSAIESSLNSSESSVFISESSIDSSEINDEWLEYQEAINVKPVIDSNAYSDLDIIEIYDQGESKQRTSDTLTFFSINDTHGALDSSVTTGMDYIYTLQENIDNENGSSIGLLLGDIFQGGWLSNKTRGRAFVEVINQMNFDAFVLGNHEFDWGLEVISKYKDGDDSNGELRIPFLGANIYYADTLTHPSWIDPYTIINHEGYKVGIIGLIGESQMSSISADKIANYEFKNTISLAKKYAKKLRVDEKCDTVVIAIHDYDESTNIKFSAFEGDERIDAIFCGHTHYQIEEYYERNDGYNIPIIQSKTKNESAGSITLTFEQNEVVSSEITHYYPDNYIPNEIISSYLQDNYGDIIKEGTSSIGYTSSSLSKSTIGNNMVKYIQNNYDVDLAIINTAGVRSTIKSGNIGMSTTMEVFPFENRLLKVELTGSQIKQLINENKNYLYYYSDTYYSLFSNDIKYYAMIIDYVYTGVYYKNVLNKTKFIDTNKVLPDLFVEMIKKYYPL